MYRERRKTVQMRGWLVSAITIIITIVTLNTNINNKHLSKGTLPKPGLTKGWFSLLHH